MQAIPYNLNLDLRVVAHFCTLLRLVAPYLYDIIILQKVWQSYFLQNFPAGISSFFACLRLCAFFIYDIVILRRQAEGLSV